MHGGAISHPGRRDAPETGKEADGRDQQRAAKHEPFVRNHVPHALEYLRIADSAGHGFGDWTRTLQLRGRLSRDVVSAALDAERDHLRYGEHREHRDNHGKSVPEPNLPKGEARTSGRGIQADESAHQPEEADDHSFDEAVAGEGRNEGDAQDGEKKKLGRTEIENDRFQYG